MHIINLLFITAVLVTLGAGTIYLICDERREYGGTYHAAVAVSIAGGCATFLVGIFVGVLFLNTKQCQEKADGMGRDWKYGLVADCRVETDDGRFVPIDNLRVTNEEDK